MNTQVTSSPVVVSLKLLALCFLFLVLPCSLRADSVYTYKAPTPYTQCQGAYASGASCKGSIFFTASFTTSLTGSQIDNISGFVNIAWSVSIFEFSDNANGSNGFVDANQNTPNSTITVLLSTDGAGMPTQWAVSDEILNFDGASRTEMCTAFNQPNNSCTNAARNITYLDSGPNFTVGWNYQPGTWTVTTTNPNPSVPEPGTLPLLATGIFGLAGLIRGKLRAL